MQSRWGGGWRARDYSKLVTGYSAKKGIRSNVHHAIEPEDHTARWRQHALEARFGQKVAASYLQEKYVAREDSLSNFLDRAGGGYVHQHAKGDAMASYKANAAKESKQLLDVWNGLGLTNTQRKAKLQKEGTKHRLETLRKKEKSETYREIVKEEQELQKHKSKEQKKQEAKQTSEEKQTSEDVLEKALAKEQHKKKTGEGEQLRAYRKKTKHTADPTAMARAMAKKSRPQYPTAKKQTGFLARLAQKAQRFAKWHESY